MSRPSKKVLCTKCGRPNNRGGRTRVCELCSKAPRGVRLAGPPSSKVCAFCREEKPSDQFYSNKARNDWLSTYCRTCHRVKETRRFENDADRAKDYRLWNRYNISLEEYNEMLVAQGFKCAMCPKKHSAQRPLNVDHSHEVPSIVRGLLCTTCNQRKLGSLTLAEVEEIYKYLTTPPATLVIGHRLVPAGKEKPKRAKRKRKYKHYKSELKED